MSSGGSHQYQPCGTHHLNGHFQSSAICPLTDHNSNLTFITTYNFIHHVFH